jgi:hypothetical protein
MPILNYTTSISVVRTASEIQEILARAGTKTVMIEYGVDRSPVAVYFEIEVAGRFVSFRLPSQWQGVHHTLQKSSAERRYKTEEQARKVAWRIIKDWVEAQVAIIEAGVADVAEVFMPYMINPVSNHTLYKDFKSGSLLLNAGEVVDGEVSNDKNLRA